QDRYGHTAWHYAVAANSPESLELLRSHTPSTLVVQAIGQWTDGPSDVKARLPLVEYNFADVHPSPSAVLSADRMRVMNGGSWTSVRATHGPPIAGSEWPRSYAYEVEIQSSSIMQIGWATKNAQFAGTQGVGDDAHAWAWDGCRKSIWNAKGGAAAILDDVAATWCDGDVLTFCVTFLSEAPSDPAADNIGAQSTSEAEIKREPRFVLCDFSVLVNGQDVGISSQTSLEVPEDNTLYPALSAERMQQVTANFGYSPFRYPLPEGYLPVAALSPDTLAAVQELHPALLGLKVEVGSPLHWAAQLGYTDLLKALLDPHKQNAYDLKRLLLVQNPEGCTPALVACRHGRLESLKLLLSYDPALTDDDSDVADKVGSATGKVKYEQLQVDFHKKTALMHACAAGQTEVARFLLKRTNASLTEVDDKDFLVTNYAVTSGNLELIDLLMAEDPDFAERSSSILSPLFYAARQGYVDVLRHLIEKHGIDPSVRDSNDHSLLHTAAYSGKVEVMQFLLDKGCCLVDDRTTADITPVLWACDGCSVSGVKYLISQGANIRDKAIRGMTALTFAIRGSNKQVAEWLIEEQGFSVNEADDEGNTPLIHACKHSELPFIKYLISKGAKTDVRGQHNYSPMHFAATQVNLEAIRYFLENGYAQPNELSSDGENVMFLLGFYGGKKEDSLEPSIETLTYLESKGVSLDNVDNTGNHLLSAIGSDDRLDVVKWLVETKGMPVNAANSEGTPLHFAVLRKATTIAHYLISRGADVNLITKSGDNILIYAALTDNLELLQHLLSPQFKGLKLSINDPNKDGMTPLLVACKSASLEVVEFLASQGASLDQVDKLNTSCFMIALRGGKQETVEWLLGRGFSIEEKDEEGKTPIFYAALHSVERVKRLLSLGARASVKDNLGYTPFLITEQAEVVKYLLDNDYASIHETNNAGQTALMFAATNGDIDLLEYLLSRGASLDEKDENERTIFMYAASGGHSKMIRHLIAKGVDVNAKDKSSMTAVFYAATNSLRVVELLVVNGARLNLRDKDNNSVVLNACFSGKTAIVKYLVSNGLASADDYNNQGMTAIMLACKGKGNLELVRFLHEHGALVDDVSKSATSTLIYAVDAQKSDIVSYLLANGADVRRREKNGKTALFFVVDSLETGRALVEHGADIHVKDDTGKTCLHFACFNGHLNWIRYLVEQGGKLEECDNSGINSILGVLASRNPEACAYVYSQLSSLDLAGKVANLNQALFDPLFETLKTNTTIHTLNLSDNGFDNTILPRLLDLLEYNQHLARIKLLDNALDVDDLMTLFECIEPEEQPKTERLKAFGCATTARNLAYRAKIMRTAFQMLMAARILLQPHPITLWLDDDPLPLEVIEIVVRQLDTYETLTDKEKSAIIAYAFDKENLGKDKWYFLKTCLPRFLFDIGTDDEDAAQAAPTQPPQTETRASTTAGMDENEEEWEDVDLASFVVPILSRLLRFIKRS
ncbi:Ankyrin repeat and SPRY domain containing protein, partial [Acanthamoeba castellanii str. Neff]